MTYSLSRVASSKQSTSTPVAIGSSVPACPMLFSLVPRRTFCTTSWLVMPDGLSTIRKPIKLECDSGFDNLIVDQLLLHLLSACIEREIRSVQLDRKSTR